MKTRAANPFLARRTFLASAALAAGGIAFFRLRRPALAVSAASPDAGKPVTVVQFSPDGRPTGKVAIRRVVKSEAEWKHQLSPLAYQVTREAGTERPFTGASLKVHDRGLFRCICCDTALFSSETKFDSGTGWPSFWKPIAPENVIETTDRTLGMARTAVSCRTCDAHLGHVFDDGPAPTGLRYCMNDVAMRFVKLA